MKKIITMGILTVLQAAMLCACANAGKKDDGVTGQDISDFVAGTESVTNGTNDIEMNNESSLLVPQELEVVPEEYFFPAAQQGTVQTAQNVSEPFTAIIRQTTRPPMCAWEKATASPAGASWSSVLML